MLDKKIIVIVREDLLSYAGKRREVIKASGDAQQLSKKAIFAAQRDDNTTAAGNLTQAENILLELNKKFKTEPELFTEGSYRAALEEFAEASFFYQFLSDKTIGKIKGFNLDSDTLVGGLCDVPGELLRFAIKAATARNFAMVEKCFATAEEIIGELVDMDLTGYNRQKFDQAKQALHKLEQVRYEVSLKNV